MKTLIEILNDNKANMSIRVGESTYYEYFAHVGFEDGKITVNVFNDEGGHYASEEEPMPFEWIEKIYKFVGELQESKHLPEYTLKLIAEK
jgi:hypothetical protein